MFKVIKKEGRARRGEFRCAHGRGGQIHRGFLPLLFPAGTKRKKKQCAEHKNKNSFHDFFLPFFFFLCRKAARGSLFR